MMALHPHRESGVNIIAATGFYTDPTLPQYAKSFTISEVSYNTYYYSTDFKHKVTMFRVAQIMYESLKLVHNYIAGFHVSNKVAKISIIIMHTSTSDGRFHGA